MTTNICGSQFYLYKNQKIVQKLFVENPIPTPQTKKVQNCS